MTIKRMLIDATHPEETRVVVLSGNRLENFDVEVESRKRLKGNIYLAKVTRVEPSLQAAFVEYGGNRHGFLSFNEVHPDYFQIPVADREVLIAEHGAAEKADEDALSAVEDGDAGDKGGVETIGGDDSEEVESRRPRPSPRRYKIQEVIKRRQILLVQVVKEERGNKGAALTTYISLAGRYCVLMPNTARGGGISRKITDGSDRKKLRSLLGGLNIPQGMAVIVRTAGAKRSRSEIKRDYEYLFRTWNDIRELTLKSIAPALIHEEANLIIRTIRDMYSSDIDEIIVDGDSAYRTAKDFIKLLIPSHAKKVQPYKNGGQPMMQYYQVESQLDSIHSPEVQLKSGGYIVINPTEALVSIDVNSGRATRERNIEETALKTNLEAADEIARHLRLRDLAGLIVIDFIDMEVGRNNVKVEKRLKEALRHDRARIQLGRISPFGLLEMSRQRLRPSLIETSSEPCPHCAGSGIRRSTESAALNVLRAIEEEGIRGRADRIAVHVPTAVALYVLNQKRASLADLETRYGFSVLLENDDSLIPPDHRIERIGESQPRDDGEAEAEQADEGGKRRRRRRSRRRQGEEKAAPEAAPEAAPKRPPNWARRKVPGKRNPGPKSPPKRRRRPPSGAGGANACPFRGAVRRRQASGKRGRGAGVALGTAGRA
ncbi:MAG: ribonuclease E/G [Proteobacteria bacterium]|nr:ribonuclease E/G [Pseudomonadota bacterium]